MIEVALEKNATAILTVNDIYLQDPEKRVRLEGQGWGNLAEAPAEALVVTASGGGFETWSLINPYFRRGDQVVFQPAQEKRDPGGELELLGDWTGNTGAA
jgi:hypothetical protein